jgi:arylsulfatase A-like enzyme
MANLSRRTVVMTGAAVGASLPFMRLSSAQASKPNILFIVADDLGYADLSCYGRREYETPVLDRMAADGLQLMQAYSNSAVCSATRVGLITGRYQYRLAYGLEEPGGRAAEDGLPIDHPTLPSLLRGSGYRTVLVGKWHLGSPPSFGPLRCGYDDFFGIYGGGADYFRHDDPQLGAGALLIDRDKPANAKGYMTDLLAERAVKEIDKSAQDGRPLFMSLHFTAPHWPWEGPRDAEVSRARNARTLFHVDGGNLKVYAEMVQSLDRNIGRVLDALEAKGMSSNTIVIFTSDNGGERFSDVWPFVGMKCELLEGGIRVPCLVRWPAVIGRRGRSEQVAISMDWMPTLLAAAGVATHPAYPCDGANLLPELTGAAPRPRKLFWRFKANEQAAMRDGDWKYLKIDGREHLFDVVQDARERANLEKIRPEIFARMKAEYQAWDKTMLPYTAKSNSYDVTGNYSDRY